MLQQASAPPERIVGKVDIGVEGDHASIRGEGQLHLPCRLVQYGEVVRGPRRQRVVSFQRQGLQRSLERLLRRFALSIAVVDEAAVERMELGGLRWGISDDCQGRLGSRVFLDDREPGARDRAGVSQLISDGGRTPQREGLIRRRAALVPKAVVPRKGRLQQRSLQRSGHRQDELNPDRRRQIFDEGAFGCCGSFEDEPEARQRLGAAEARVRRRVAIAINVRLVQRQRAGPVLGRR